MKKVLIILFILGGIQLVKSQLYAEIDTAQIKIGEPVNYTLNVPIKQNDVVQLPIIKDTLSHHIEVLNKRIDTIYQGENKEIQLKIQVTSYEPGNFLVRGLPVVINKDTLLSQSFQLQVLEVKIDSANLQGFPIKPIIAEKYTLKDYWNKYWVYLAAIVVFLIIGLAILILFLMEKKQNKKASAPPKSAYEEAIENLQQLDKKDYLAKGDVKNYYSTLSYILKNYLGRRFNFSSLELLSDELVDYLQKADYLTETDLKQSSLFLIDSDLVKYAKATPSQEKHQHYRQFIQTLVENTKPILIETEELQPINSPKNYRKIK